jgi:hypothetical protein
MKRRHRNAIVLVALSLRSSLEQKNSIYANGINASALRSMLPHFRNSVE